MFCNTKIPSQVFIYEALTANREGRHKNTITNFDEFKAELSDLKTIKKGSEYMLFIDPYDNQGQ